MALDCKIRLVGLIATGWYIALPYRLRNFPSLDKEGWRVAPGWFESGDSKKSDRSAIVLHSGEHEKIYH
jgi:hypothetical protein